MRIGLVSGLSVMFVTGIAHATEPTNPAPPPAVLVESPPPPRPLEWNPEWSRASALDYVITGVGLATALTFAILPAQPTHFTSTNPFDDAVRNALRLPTYEARHAAGDTSDVLLSLVTTYPVLFDAFALGYGYWRSADAAYQMTVINAEALAISAGIQGATNFAVSRERPYGQATPAPSICSQYPTLGECNGPTLYRSFFSGHATISFTAAGLTCSHHLHLRLFGNGGDAASCVVALVVATSISALRVIGDYHYATDVLTGAAVGSAVGFIVPAIHYAKHNRSKPTSDLEWHIAPSIGGIGIAGTW
jgi:membrane-associated phospholipid phosphatase